MVELNPSMKLVEMKKVLQQGRDRPLHCAYGGTKAGLALLLDVKRQGRMLQTELQSSQGGLQAPAFGVASRNEEDAHHLEFRVNKGVEGHAKKLVKTLRGTDVKRVTILLEEDKLFETADLGGEDAGGAAAAPGPAEPGAADAGVAPPAANQNGAAKPAAAPAAAQPSPAVVQLTQQLRELASRIPLTAARKAELFKLAFDTGASIKAGKLDDARAALAKLKAEVDVLAPAADQPGAPDATPAPERPALKGDETLYNLMLKNIATAETRCKRPPPGSEVAKLKAGFNAVPTPKPAAAPIQDYVAACVALEAKHVAAQQVNKAALEFDSFARGALKTIRNAGVYALQSGAPPGMEKVSGELADIMRQVDAALKRGEYDDALQLVFAARDKAEPITLRHETIVRAEQSKPMFERAEKLLTAKKRVPELKALKPEYDQALIGFGTALKGSDANSLSAALDKKLRVAKKILAEGQKTAVDEWLDGQLQQPASGESGVATGLTTMPDLDKMSEAERFAAMTKRKGQKADVQKAAIRRTYAEALREGLKLDLTPSEMTAMNCYSGPLYAEVNAFLRGTLDLAAVNPARLDLIKVQVALMTQALAKLPRYSKGASPLFRWETPYGNYMKTRYKRGTTFEIKEFWSTGAGGGSVADGDYPTAEILVWGKKRSKAKDISLLSAFGAEEGNRADGHKLKGQGAGEVLFPPGTTFKTMKTIVLDGKGKVMPQRVNTRAGDAEVEFRYRIEVKEV